MKNTEKAPITTTTEKNSSDKSSSIANARSQRRWERLHMQEDGIQATESDVGGQEDCEDRNRRFHKKEKSSKDTATPDILKNQREGEGYTGAFGGSH